MTFFWKIFFSTLLISVSFFSVGLYLLMDRNFNSAMEREIDAAYDLSDIIHYSMNNELKNQYNVHVEMNVNEKQLAALQEKITNTANAMNINHINGLISFRISDSDYQIVFSSLNSIPDNDMLKEVSENEKGYTFHTTSDDTYVQVFRPTTLYGERYYIEVLRDVSHIFYNQQQQYEMFIKLIIAMLIVVGGITAVISKWLTKPVKRLTEATNEIASGHFNKQIEIKSRDEFAVLLSHFNTMAAKLEKQMNELKQEAEKQELFVASFSHELKTPLTSIIGYADMLRTKRMSNENIVLSAQYIFEEGKRLEKLSMRLLEIVALKQKDIIVKKVSVQTFLDETIKSLQPVCEKSEIKIKQHVEPGRIEIEPELIKTVCLNLLDNARKAIGSNGQIVVTGKQQNDHYEISICDNGKGMEESELDKITQAFYMVDQSRTHVEGGVGLGLSLSAEILKLHEATMYFTSKVNQGTCVTIPLKKAVDDYER
ncbi:HAMP domain-containing histidine kinase [Bacillaceae bacterium SIJ1]|uniref:sensor histidine kinase n=1 Tax=Litoribacterium kuwaitense TaxID=1398745 RepID=UPI0013E99E94|nr:HAMP domain-containing sensor histidine kinase [Litoribacterium kuwaitense]NGP43564.1 HAMP domain-containing histidine kinase [Litoribacterium kuwaitense]